jgi:hypothetical protein
MKFIICLVALCLAVASAVDVKMTEEDYLKKYDEIPTPSFKTDFVSTLEVEATQIPTDSAIATYVPESGPFDNAATSDELVQTLPQTPSCTIRGQTVFEIRKMRADAKQIGLAIMYEIQIMEKRKAYIEQMTTYLNDRIREMNKVKTDLAAEQKWIQISNARISELAQREKLIKLQDVMTCIRNQQQRVTGESATKNTQLKNLQAQAQAVDANINNIRSKMNHILNTTSY